MKKIISIVIGLCLLSTVAFAGYGSGAYGEIAGYLKSCATNIVPSLTNTYNLGSASKLFANIYVTTMNVTSLVLANGATLANAVDGTVTLTENSDILSWVFDGSDIYQKWSDGNLYLMTDEGTNADSNVYVRGKGTGKAFVSVMEGTADTNKYIAMCMGSTTSQVASFLYGSSTTGVVFNDSSRNADFTIETDNSATAFVVNSDATAGNETVSIGLNSDTLTWSMDASDIYQKWSDGNLYLMTDEGTNSDSKAYIKGKGTGSGILVLFDGSAATNSTELQQVDGGFNIGSDSGVSAYTINSYSGTIDTTIKTKNSATAFVVNSDATAGNEYVSTTLPFRVGSSTAYSRSAIGANAEINQATGYGGLGLNNWGSALAGNQCGIEFARAKSAAIGTFTAVGSGDGLGFIEWLGADGTDWARAAELRVEVDGAVGAGDMPGRMIFATTPDGAEVPVERMRIDNAGAIWGCVAPYTVPLGHTAVAGDLSIGTAANYADLNVSAFSAAQIYHGANLNLNRSNSSTFGTMTATIATDTIGQINFNGVDTGANFRQQAAINAYQTGAAGATGAATDLYFSTSNGTTCAERMRIDSAGRVGIGCSPATIFEVAQNQDAASTLTMTNTNTGSSARSRIMATCGSYSALMYANHNTGAAYVQGVGGGLIMSAGLGNIQINAPANYGLVINEDGVDADFRIESDTLPNAFVVDGETGDVRGTNTAISKQHDEIGILLDCLTAPKAIVGFTGTGATTTTESGYESGAGRVWTYSGGLAADKIFQGSTYVYSFDGTDSYLSTPDTADMTFALGAASWGGWVQITDTATTDTIISKWDETTGAEKREWLIVKDNTEKIAFYIYDETENKQCSRATDAALSVGWHYITITYDGAANCTGTVIYVDGVAVASTATNDAGFVSMRDTDYPVNIGTLESTAGVGANWWAGDMGRLFVTGEALSAADVWKLYEQTRGHYNK